MLLKKDYEGGLLATLNQDQEQMRNHDSRNHLPGFVRFNFYFHSSFAETFSTASVNRVDSAMSATCPLYLQQLP
jgi:hypothetical protein